MVHSTAHAVSCAHQQRICSVEGLGNRAPHKWVQELYGISACAPNPWAGRRRCGWQGTLPGRARISTLAHAHAPRACSTHCLPQCPPAPPAHTCSLGALLAAAAQVLHDAFFKYQTKPKLTQIGDMYYEGKEFEARIENAKPGVLSEDLRK